MSDSVDVRAASTMRSLDAAIKSWTGKGDAEKLRRWLQGQLGDEGAPVRLSLPSWWISLNALLEARTERPGWSNEIDTQLLELARAVLRFSRPDGIPATTEEAALGSLSAARMMRAIVRAFPGSDVSRVASWWFPCKGSVHVPPPLPAWSSTSRALAVLRASWIERGDFLVIDHRQAGPSTNLELVGDGRILLKGGWDLESTGGKTPTAARLTAWVSSSSADLCEWSCRSGGHRVTRTALLFRGRRLALLADQIDDLKDMSLPVRARLCLPADVSIGPIAESRGLMLKPANGKTGAQVLPVALPALPHPTEKGHFQVLPGNRQLEQSIVPRGRRCWMPWLISWNPARSRKRLHWRVLTITERTRLCPPEEAFAVRVSWGRSESLVIYRSLAEPVRRAFLGYQTSARMLVGQFTEDGTVEPIFSVD